MLGGSRDAEREVRHSEDKPPERRVKERYDMKAETQKERRRVPEREQRPRVCVYASWGKEGNRHPERGGQRCKRWTEIPRDTEKWWRHRKPH